MNGALRVGVALLHWLVLPSLFVGCIRTRSSDAATSETESEWIGRLPLDTAQLLQELDLLEMGRAGDVEAGSITWREEVDTILVRYVAFACTCPDHELVDTAGHEGIAAFYLQPMGNCPEIPWRSQVSGNTFELIGQRSRIKMWPDDSMGPPELGYHFRYFAFRIMHPYRIWGPHVPTEDLDGDGSSDTEPTLLEVR